MDMKKLFKSPIAIGVGLLIGLFLLYAMSRGKSGGGSSAGDMTMASMATTASSNVALAGYTTDYNKAALGYQAGLAQIAAENHATDVNASMAISQHSLSMLDNIAQAAANVNAIRETSRATVNLAHENNEAMLSYANIQSNTLLATNTTQSDLVRYLADVDSSKSLELARINERSQNTLADINNETARRASENEVRKTKVNALSSMFNNFFG